jgi:hypothetical protein
MVAVPAATPVTTPVELFTVATAALLVVQAPPVLPFEVKVVLPVPHIVCVPLKVPALAAAVTVTVRVAVALVQPPVPVTVYVMVAVPAATPVTTPVELFTVATAALLVLHAPPVLPFEVNVVLPVPQMACVPLTVPALGAATTVTVVEPDIEKPVASETVRL